MGDLKIDRKNTYRAVKGVQLPPNCCNVDPTTGAGERLLGPTLLDGELVLDTLENGQVSRLIS